MPRNKYEEKKVLLHRSIVLIRNALTRSVHFNRIGIIIIDPELRIATELAQAIHSLPMHSDAQEVSPAEIWWINNHVKPFLATIDYNHFAARVMITYLHTLMDLLPSDVHDEINSEIREILDKIPAETN